MCDCIENTNKALKERGVELVPGIRFMKDMSSMVAFVPIATKPIDDSPVGRGHRKKSTPVILPSYCPFCGEKQGEE